MKSTNQNTTKLLNIQAFCLTYELGSFTKAARALGITPQAASRSVARLESSLGVLLFRRNTRSVRPTDAGTRYYESCHPALEMLQAAQAEIGAEHSEAQGSVRVSVPTTYGHHRFLPMLADFRAAYPRVEVDVEVSNYNVDFVKEGFDLAVRMGKQSTGSFISRRLGDFSLGVFASPDYLRKKGSPKTPADIGSHACAVFVMPNSGRLLPWVFARRPRELMPPATVRVRVDFLGLISVACAGAGLIQTYHYLIERELARGDLVEVLAPYAGRSRRFSLLYPRDTAKRPAVRALVNFTMERARPDLAKTAS